MKTAFRSVFPGAAAVGLGLAARELILRRREADFEGQVALITGATRGLGLALARSLAEDGCHLAICAREFDELDRTARDLEAQGVDVLALTCDVTIEADVNAMVETVLDHYGHIDLLFTVAGVIEVAQLDLLEIQDFRHAMDVMFWGTLYPVMAVLPAMRARHYGRIATITSIGGKISVPHLLPYSAAKFAAVGLSEGLAAELARDGIRVTTIVPGLMRTGSHLNARFKGDEKQQEAEYTWFSLGATMPLATNAERAARIVIQAVKREETERIYSLPFALASRFHGLAPATTIRLMQVVNALLPKQPAGNNEDAPLDRGVIVAAHSDSRLAELATTMGAKAAEDLQQKPGPVHTEDA
jgi:NAD(P)-dependent dehydrogenase (short-subunit alcohol dehydrogenase family)